MYEEEKTFPKELLRRIQDHGRIEEKLKVLTDHEIFDNLSKHNPYWESTDEVAAEKLHDIRMQLSYILEQIYEITSIATYDE